MDEWGKKNDQTRKTVKETTTTTKKQKSGRSYRGEVEGLLGVHLRDARVVRRQHACLDTYAVVYPEELAGT